MKGSEKNFHHFVEQLTKSGGIQRVSTFAITSGLSRRMIYYYLDELNYYLKSNNAKSYIQGENLSSEQLYLCQHLLKVALEKEEGKIFSSEEREIIMIYYLLFEIQKLTIRFFEELFLISKNTVLKDIVQLRNRLNSFEIDLRVNKMNGYYLAIDEFRRRQFVYIFFHLLSTPKLSECAPYINNLIQERNTHWTQMKIEQLVTIINSTSATLLKEIAEDDTLILAQTLLALEERTPHLPHLLIPDVFDTIIKNRIEYGAAQQLTYQLTNIINRPILDAENKMIGIYLLCVEKDIDEHYLAPYFQHLYTISREIISLFQRKYGISFENLDDTLKNVQTYMKVAFYRSIFHMNIPNKSYRVVLERYPKVFHIVKRIIAVLDSSLPIFQLCFPQSFSEDMLSDLTIVFEAAILREQTRSYVLQALIVSDSSKVECSLIQSHITQHLQSIQIVDVVSSKKVKMLTHDVELCITTIPHYLHPTGKTLYIQSVPTEKDIEKIQHLQYEFFHSRKRRLKIKYLLEEFYKTNDMNTALSEIEHVYLGLNKTRANRKIYTLQEYIDKKQHLTYWDCHKSLQAIVEDSCSKFIQRNTASLQYRDELLKIVENSTFYYTHQILIICGDYRSGAFSVDIQVNYFQTPIIVNAQKISTVYILVSTENMMHIPLIFEIEDRIRQQSKYV